MAELAAGKSTFFIGETVETESLIVTKVISHTRDCIFTKEFVELAFRTIVDKRTLSCTSLFVTGLTTIIVLVVLVGTAVLATATSLVLSATAMGISFVSSSSILFHDLRVGVDCNFLQDFKIKGEAIYV